MKKLFKSISFVISISFVFAALLSFVSAVSEDTTDKLYNNNGGIVAVSHRGDSSSFPKNSLEAVIAAAKEGADMVSVSVQKTKDGVFVLCENAELSEICQTDKDRVSELDFKELSSLRLYNSDGSKSECKIETLENLLVKIPKGVLIILDNCWQYRDEIVRMCEQKDCINRVILRTEESASDITKWLKEFGKSIQVIGVYKGNIVFNAQSHLKKLSNLDQIIVQYQSKNYFNVVYNSFTAKKYSADGNARALSPMYDKDLCGQRDDSVAGWDEIIQRGFSVIETNNIKGLKTYISETDAQRKALIALFEKSKSIASSDYSDGSAKSFGSAYKKADEVLKNSNASLGDTQEAYSALVQSMNNLKAKTSEDSQRGSLNITVGKVMAVIIFGAVILAGEIYVYKMQKRRKDR